MSDTEPTFIWQFSIGTILTIITTLSIVGGGFMAFLRHLRSTKETSEKALAELVDMKKTIQGHEQNTTEHLKHNLERIGELKTMMSMIDRRIDEVKNDATKKVDEQKEEIAELAKMLQRFRDELHDLVIDVEKRVGAIANEDRRMRSIERDEDRTQRRIERRSDRDTINKENTRRQEYEGDTGGGGGDFAE